MHLRLVFQTLLSPALWSTFVVTLISIFLFNVLTQTDIAKLQSQQQAQWLELMLHQHEGLLEQGLATNNLLLLQGNLNLLLQPDLILGVQLESDNLEQAIMLGQPSAITIQHAIVVDKIEATLTAFASPNNNVQLEQLYIQDSLLMVLLAFCMAFGLIAWRKHHENRWWRQLISDGTASADAVSEILQHSSHLTRMKIWLGLYRQSLRIGRQQQTDLPDNLVHRLTWNTGKYKQAIEKRQSAFVLSIALGEQNQGAEHNLAIALCEKVAHLYSAKLYVQDRLYLIFNINDANQEFEATLTAASLIRDMLCAAQISMHCAIQLGDVLHYKNTVNMAQLLASSTCFSQCEIMHQCAQTGQILMSESIFNFCQTQPEWLFEIVRDVSAPSGELIELWQLTDLPATQQQLILNQSDILTEKHFAP